HAGACSRVMLAGGSRSRYNHGLRFGGIAQLGERLHGMQEVSGSIPLTSTNRKMQSPSSRGLGHRPFTAITGVRIPVGTPYIAARSSAGRKAGEALAGGSSKARSGSSVG